MGAYLRYRRQLAVFLEKIVVACSRWIAAHRVGGTVLAMEPRLEKRAEWTRELDCPMGGVCYRAEFEVCRLVSTCHAVERSRNSRFGLADIQRDTR